MKIINKLLLLIVNYIFHKDVLGITDAFDFRQHHAAPFALQP